MGGWSEKISWIFLVLYPKMVEITGGEVNIANYLKAVGSKR